MKQQIPLIKGDKISPNTDYRDFMPVNMTAVPKPILGANGYMLCYPGLTQIATGSGTDRGAVYNRRMKIQFRVSGKKLIKVVAGVVTELGTVPGTGQAAMPYSFNTQAVIADGRMFLYDATNGFREVTDSDLGSPIDGVWVDGYYFLTDGEYIYHTDLADESSIDPLKFATAEFMPDDSIGLGITPDDKVIVFGRDTTEYFVNQATANFAFQRVQTRAQKIGIVATHAKCESGGNWYFAGGRAQDSLGVFVLGVGQSVRVSTREIDKVLATYTETALSDMRMESRTEDDVELVIVHLSGHALCYNATVAATMGKDYAWSILRTGSSATPHRAINGVFDADLGYWVYGDKTGTQIGKLDNTVFSQYGSVSEWILSSPFINLETASIDELEIETIPGNTPFDDATVAFSLTKDGQTYSTEWWNLYGEPNDYNHRYILRRLGDVSQWVGFKFRAVTKSRMAFCYLTVTYG